MSFNISSGHSNINVELCLNKKHANENVRVTKNLKMKMGIFFFPSPVYKYNIIQTSTNISSVFVNTNYMAF